MNPLSNLKLLRQDMQSKQIAVTLLMYQYNNVNCYIAVCLLTEEEKITAHKYYPLVRLRFIDVNNLERYIDCYANSNGLSSGIRELREFFHIQYQSDLRSWIISFYQHLGKRIPVQCPPLNEEHTTIILNTICDHEKRDPNRTYRHHIFRNGKRDGKQLHRTEYNSQLASFKFPKIYPSFKNDTTISFAFTSSPENEVSEEKALYNFWENERHKH